MTHKIVNEWITTPLARNDMDMSNHESEDVNDTTATRDAELVSASQENIMLNECEASPENVNVMLSETKHPIDIFVKRDSSAPPQNDVLPQNDKEWIATPTARNDMDKNTLDMSLRGGQLSDEVIHSLTVDFKHY